MGTWRLENNLGCHLQKHQPPLERRDLSLAWSSPIRLDGLAHELQGLSVPVFTEPELQAYTLELGVFM